MSAQEDNQVSPRSPDASAARSGRIEELRAEAAAPPPEDAQRLPPHRIVARALLGGLLCGLLASPGVLIAVKLFIDPSLPLEAVPGFILWTGFSGAGVLSIEGLARGARRPLRPLLIALLTFVLPFLLIGTLMWFYLLVEKGPLGAWQELVDKYLDFLGSYRALGFFLGFLCPYTTLACLRTQVFPLPRSGWKRLPLVAAACFVVGFLTCVLFEIIVGEAPSKGITTFFVVVPTFLVPVLAFSDVADARLLRWWVARRRG